jgi:hypothetical protein
MIASFVPRESTAHAHASAVRSASAAALRKTFRGIIAHVQSDAASGIPSVVSVRCASHARRDDAVDTDDTFDVVPPPEKTVWTAGSSTVRTDADDWAITEAVLQRIIDVCDTHAEPELDDT